MSSRLRKIAFFDFCETIVNFQTADGFVDFVRRFEGNFFMRLLNVISIVLKKLRIILLFSKYLPDALVEKKLKLLQLRGFTYERLDNLAEQYYHVMIKPNLIKLCIDEMEQLRGQNYEICVVSAGYSIYIKYFAEDYHIQHIISTEIAYDKSGIYCLGTILGKDCSDNEKISRIRVYFNDRHISFNESIAYSDSKTDLPLLLLTGKGVVVSKTNSQQWCHQYKFKEIIWG